MVKIRYIIPHIYFIMFIFSPLEQFTILPILKISNIEFYLNLLFFIFITFFEDFQFLFQKHLEF